MFALALALSTLSLLVLAAHFLRRGQVEPCVAVLGVLVVMFVLRRGWVRRVVQVLLLLAVVLWTMTLFAMVQARQAAGEPAGRLVAILGAVIAVNVAAAAVLGTRAVGRRYSRGAPQPPAAH